MGSEGFGARARQFAILGELTYRRSAMKAFSNGVKWITAAALLMSVTASPAFAAKTTPATDKNTNVPAVPRAIPDLIPYHKFDPPKSKAFERKNPRQEKQHS